MLYSVVFLKVIQLFVVAIGFIAWVNVWADVKGKQIGDLEIYQPAEQSTITMMMMLDTSGSMSALVAGCQDAGDMPSNIQVIDRKSENSNTIPNYTRHYCIGSDGKRYYDRLTRLKDAIFTLMDSPRLDSQIVMGIGQYPSQSDSENIFTFADHRSGKIVVPARPLDQTQRLAIKTAVAQLQGIGATPTANAYAEVSAYMMGETTYYGSQAQNYFFRFIDNQYVICGKWQNNHCEKWYGWYPANSAIIRSGILPAYQPQKINGFDGRLYVGDKVDRGFLKSTKEAKSGIKYKSPLPSVASECHGQGIYFLTDGEPNNAFDPLSIMKSALGSKASQFNIGTHTLKNGSMMGHAMPEIGEFAKALRNPEKNPIGREIKTAVVGFGSVFDVDKHTDSLKPEAQKIIRYLSDNNNSTKKPYYNCELINNIDAKNACNWGAKSHPKLPNVGGFGEGGFFSAQSTEDLIDSMVQFTHELNHSIPSAPSGTIAIADDPYQAGYQQSTAFLPTVEAKVSENLLIWSGNLQKYQLNNGTLYANNQQKVFLDDSGRLNPEAIDDWSGGMYAQLTSPFQQLGSGRTVFVEDSLSANTTNTTNTTLRKIGVDASGKPFGFKELTHPIYTDTIKRILLNFLGFDNLPAVAVENMQLSQPSHEIKVLGSIIHSTPTVITYSATLDDIGRISQQRDDYILFGSTDGVLHLLNNRSGKETLAIIPLTTLQNQPNALVHGATHSAIGLPKFGIDAPWLASMDYQYDWANKKVTVKVGNNQGVFVYGGLRMGGEGLYAMDLSNYHQPKMLFYINHLTHGFHRIGKIWAKPSKGKIKLHAKENPIDVLIFGGGYDNCYEYESFAVNAPIDYRWSQACHVKSRSQTQGNAIYMINAKTGQLIWSASSANNTASLIASINHQDMKNSIVAGVTVLDRNNDNLLDHIYFADLGGQVFRADFINAGSIDTEGKTIEAFQAIRVNKILQNAHQTASQYSYRFYERPVVSFYRNPDNQQLFAVVNVISGDRSSPLSKMRDNPQYADRLYAIFDNDITKADSVFYDKKMPLTVNNLQDKDFVKLPATHKNTDLQMVKSKQGWYYPLTRFDGFQQVKFSKGVGKSAVIDNVLYTTVYNPDMRYHDINPCHAKIVGGSEQQLYCMPYGICQHSASETGTGGFIRAGQGIQELAFGASHKNNPYQRLLINPQTLLERSKNRVNYHHDGNKNRSLLDDVQYLHNPHIQQQGGDGSAIELIFNERFIFQPKAWYEVE